MQINEDLWIHHQHGVLVSFIHHLAYYKVLFLHYKASDNKSEFWKWTIDAHLNNAIVDWCMVFGTDANEVHWKNVLLDDHYRADFLHSLKSVTGMDKMQFRRFWVEITEFRNKYATHRNTSDAYPSVPYMDKACCVAICYDDCLRTKIVDIIYEPSLRERYERLLRTSENIFKKLINCGPSVDQEYGKR